MNYKFQRIFIVIPISTLGFCPKRIFVFLQYIAIKINVTFLFGKSLLPHGIADYYGNIRLFVRTNQFSLSLPHAPQVDLFFTFTFISNESLIPLSGTGFCSLHSKGKTPRMLELNRD